MKKSISLVAVYFFICTGFCLAQLNPPFIASNYYKGVVKILLYDPVLEQAMNLKAGDGYLGRGSGFIVTEDGILFTNRHVVEQCVYGYLVADYTDEYGKEYKSYPITYKEGLEHDPAITKIHYAGHAIPLIQVYYGEGEKDFKLYIAEVLTLSESFDGAMLKIVSDMDGNPVKTAFKAVPIGNSNAAKQGEKICVYGYPAQYDGDMALAEKDMSTMTMGYHSGWDYVFNENYGFIKTDASINGGNSGGPAFGENNRVVGIASAKGTKTGIGLVGGINGMYYVVAPRKDILNKLIAKGLTVPTKAGAVATITGEPRALPHVNGTYTAGTNNSQNYSADNNKNTGGSGGSSNDILGRITGNPGSSATPGSSGSSKGAMSVTGQVKSADTGHILVGASITLLLPTVKDPKTKDDYVIVATGESDGGGAFVLSPLVKAGTYVFVALLDGYENIVTSVEVGADKENSFSVKMGKSR